MHQKHDRDKDEGGTPITTRLLMALVAIVALVGIYYFLGGSRFPTEISYDRLW